jgi:hypothetical protein
MIGNRQKHDFRKDLPFKQSKAAPTDNAIFLSRDHGLVIPVEHKAYNVFRWHLGELLSEYVFQLC